MSRTIIRRCFNRAPAGGDTTAAQAASTRRRVGMRLLLAATVLLTGCAIAGPGYVGEPADPENRLPLSGIGQESIWRTREVAIHYTASRKEADFHIDGRVERLGPIKNFAFIDAFRVSIHFIDAEGIIVASHLLWSAGFSDPRIVRWTFSRRYDMLPDAAAFGFSYRGTFSEGGEDDSGRADWDVWKLP